MSSPPPAEGSTTPGFAVDDFDWPPREELDVFHPDDVFDSAHDLIPADLSSPSTASALEAFAPEGNDFFPAEHEQMVGSMSSSARESALDAFGAGSTRLAVHDAPRTTATDEALIARPMEPAWRSTGRPGARGTSILRPRRPHFAALAVGIACGAIAGVYVSQHQVRRAAVSAVASGAIASGGKIAAAAPDHDYVPAASSDPQPVPVATNPQPEERSRPADATTNLTQTGASERVERPPSPRTEYEILAPRREVAPRGDDPAPRVDPVRTSGAGAADSETSARSVASTPGIAPASSRAPLETPVAAPVTEDHVSPPAATALKTDRAPSADAAGGIIVASEEQRIVAVLKRYTDAYADLNAAATKAVWPTVDVRALSRAFGALEYQEVVFDGCTVDLAGSDARAVCQGNLTYVPKIGRKSPRTVGQRWSFLMKKTSDEWTITRAEMR